LKNHGSRAKGKRLSNGNVGKVKDRSSAGSNDRHVGAGRGQEGNSAPIAVLTASDRVPGSNGWWSFPVARVRQALNLTPGLVSAHLVFSALDFESTSRRRPSHSCESASGFAIRRSAKGSRRRGESHSRRSEKVLDPNDGSAARANWPGGGKGCAES
jgi:hypothetical protein